MSVAAGEPSPPTGPGSFRLLHSLDDPATNSLAALLNGRSTAIDGDLAVVGAPYASLENDREGEVRVYDVRTGALLHTLLKPAPRYGLFGHAVAISGTRIVVGEPGEVAIEPFPGLVYVYDVASATPSEPIHILENPEISEPISPLLNPGSAFGYSVAIDGARVIVGAPYHDEGAVDAGSVYVFDLSSGFPTHPSVTLHNPRPGSDDRFGWSVAASGLRVVVGAVLDNQNDFKDTGSAHVYDLSLVDPSLPVVTLDNPTPADFDQFGFAVSISGTHVVVGARYDGTEAVESGSAYVYDITRPTPTIPVVTLNNPSPGMFDNFGFSVAINDWWVVVGAIGDFTGGAAAGSTYVYNLAAMAGSLPMMTLTNPSPAPGDYFGWAVAMSGTRILVGAPYDDSAGIDAGSVYAYDISSGAPSSATQLTKPNLITGLLFGYSIALAGSRLAVGAPGEGAVRIYDLSGGAPLAPVLTVTNPRAAEPESFGHAVAISDSRLVVGAPEANRVYVYGLNELLPTLPLLTFTNPGPALGDNFGASLAMSDSRIVVGAPNSGHVYLFDLAGSSSETPLVTFTNPNPGREDRFGASVAIEADQVVVGAPWDDTDNVNAGIAYVYDMSHQTPGVPRHILRDPVPGSEDYFGIALALSGGRVVVGSYSDSSPNGAIAAGAAHVFDLVGPTPTLPIVTLPNPDPARFDSFGWSVAIDGSLVVVGAGGDDETAVDAGAAYVYELSSVTPAIPIAILRNPRAGAGDYFGNAVAIDGFTMAVGAPYDDFRATDRGSVHVFDVRPMLQLVPAPAAPGSLTISWTPSSFPGFILQQSETLATGSANWVNAPSLGTNPVTFPAGSGVRFFRLISESGQ